MGDGSWIKGAVKVWAPPRLFEFSWHEGLDNPGAVDWFKDQTKSVLRIDLVETGDNQTLLNLLQFSPAQSAVGGATGWHHFAGERLSSYLDTVRCDDNPGRFDEIKKLYEYDARIRAPGCDTP